MLNEGNEQRYLKPFYILFVSTIKAHPREFCSNVLDYIVWNVWTLYGTILSTVDLAWPRSFVLVEAEMSLTKSMEKGSMNRKFILNKLS